MYCNPSYVRSFAVTRMSLESLCGLDIVGTGEPASRIPARRSPNSHEEPRMTSRSTTLPLYSLCTWSRIGAASIMLLTLTVAGCWSSETEAPRASSASASTQELIGGFAANSSQFNAIGSVLITASDPFGGPYPAQVCTGTLIDSDTVLTAKHCVDAVRYTPNATMSFGLGPNSASPTTSVNVIAYQVADPNEY